VRYSIDMDGMAWGFVHKRLFRGAVGLITGGPLAAATGFLAPVSRARRVPGSLDFSGFSPCNAGMHRSNRPNRMCVPGLPINPTDSSPRAQPFRAVPPSSGAGRCPFPQRWDANNQRCTAVPFLGTGRGIDPTPVGNAVMGQYGAALEPGNMQIARAVCVRGMVLGNDNLCYNRSQIRNGDRMWPRGRRPLLTGGDMRAISTAARTTRRIVSSSTCHWAASSQ